MWDLIALHAFFAATYTLGKASIAYAQPVFFIGMRMIASGLLLLMLRLFAGRSFHIRRQDYLRFGGIALFQIYLSYVPEFYMLRHISSAKWALIYTLTPFGTAAIGYILGKERMNWIKWIGLAIGFVGIIPALLLHPDEVAFYISPTEMIFLAGMMSYSYGWILDKQLVTHHAYDAMLVNGVGMSLGGLAGLLSSPILDNWYQPLINNITGFTLTMAALIVVTAVTFSVNTYLLRFYSTTFLMFLMFVDPLYAGIYGRIFLSEPISWSFLISVLMVCCGLYIFYQEELKERQAA